MPRAIIVVGPSEEGDAIDPNELLPGARGGPQLVSLDRIAAGLSPFAPDTARFAAARLMVKRLDELVAQRVDFILETKSSTGNWLTRRIVYWEEAGYSVEIVFGKVTGSQSFYCEAGHSDLSGAEAQASLGFDPERALQAFRRAVEKALARKKKVTTKPR